MPFEHCCAQNKETESIVLIFLVGGLEAVECKTVGRRCSLGPPSPHQRCSLSLTPHTHTHTHTHCEGGAAASASHHTHTHTHTHCEGGAAASASHHKGGAAAFYAPTHCQDGAAALALHCWDGAAASPSVHVTPPGVTCERRAPRGTLTATRR